MNYADSDLQTRGVFNQLSAFAPPQICLSFDDAAPLPLDDPAAVLDKCWGDSWGMATIKIALLDRKWDSVAHVLNDRAVADSVLYKREFPFEGKSEDQSPEEHGWQWVVVWAKARWRHAAGYSAIDNASIKSLTIHEVTKGLRLHLLAECPAVRVVRYYIAFYFDR